MDLPPTEPHSTQVEDDTGPLWSGAGFCSPTGYEECPGLRELKLFQLALISCLRDARIGGPGQRGRKDGGARTGEVPGWG